MHHKPEQYDVAIIGAGIVGCATARFLSRYALKTVVLEACADISEGATKANSGIVHAGYDAAVGSNKAKYNLRGNVLFNLLQSELHYKMKQNGSLILCLDGQDTCELETLQQRGMQNGVGQMRMLNQEELFALEPHVSPNAIAALYAPSGGIVCPYGAAQAFAENAATNGIAFRFHAPVQAIAKQGERFTLTLPQGDIQTRLVINAAGVHCDEISAMAGGIAFTILPRRGEYCIFDKTVGNLVRHTLFQLPSEMGKGVLVTPTVDGNLMVGPNAIDQQSKTDISNTASGLDEILLQGARSVSALPRNKIITSFTGLRAHEASDDFYVGEDAYVKGLYHAAGIESPGLTAAPAIAEDLAAMVADALQPDLNASFEPQRLAAPSFSDMDDAQREAAIAGDAGYARIVCRCETVTEAEILAAIRTMPGATTIDGIKRRTRAGMGRCQGGFCLPKVLPLLAAELGVEESAIGKRDARSNYITGRIKEDLPCID
ncbi:NAD(P)/FAD-dependent oxidoreductase [Eubacteriales bacterium OttesenSCG-928-N14]|nr:NAD(P)/FAD-dependent oxidoreductase [Eubacteriales bacterium OttesenSCG-928-N14]